MGGQDLADVQIVMRYVALFTAMVENAARNGLVNGNVVLQESTVNDRVGGPLFLT